MIKIRSVVVGTLTASLLAMTVVSAPVAMAGDARYTFRIPGPKAVGFLGKWHSASLSNTDCVIVVPCRIGAWTRTAPPSSYFYFGEAGQLPSTAQATRAARYYAGYAAVPQPAIHVQRIGGITYWVSARATSVPTSARDRVFTAQYRTRVVSLGISRAPDGPMPVPPTAARWREVIRALVLPSGGTLPIAHFNIPTGSATLGSKRDFGRGLFN